MALWSLSTLKKLLLFFIIQLVVIWFLYEKRGLLSSLFTSPPPEVYRGLLNGTKSINGVFHLPLYQDEDMKHFYAEVTSSTWCFKEGTNLEASKKASKCICHDQWYGLDCGIPSAVWESNFLLKGKRPGVSLKRRERPRRVIVSVIMQNEYEILEVLTKKVNSVVDVILVSQFVFPDSNNHQSSGSFDLPNGILKDYQYKFIYLTISVPVNLSSHLHEKLWLNQAEEILSKHLWQKVADFRPDDIFIFTETSVISRHVISFLKLYSGYPEPIYLHMSSSNSVVCPRRSRLNCTRPLVPMACTFDFLRVLCGYDIRRFRAGLCKHNWPLVQKFVQDHWPVKRWKMGTKTSPAGWNCKRCPDVENQEPRKMSNHPRSTLMDDKNLTLSKISGVETWGNSNNTEAEKLS